MRIPKGNKVNKPSECNAEDFDFISKQHHSD